MPFSSAVAAVDGDTEKAKKMVRLQRNVAARS